MTISEENLLIEKAKTRKDGIYSFGEYKWVVKNSRFAAFANYFGECYIRAYGFNVYMGKVDRYDRDKKLKEWLKQRDS